MKVKVPEYKIRNGPNWWQISISVKVILEQIPLDLTIYKIYTFKIRDFETVGQSYDVQLSQ